MAEENILIYILSPVNVEMPVRAKKLDALYNISSPISPFSGTGRDYFVTLKPADEASDVAFGGSLGGLRSRFSSSFKNFRAF